MDDLAALVAVPADLFYCDPPWGDGHLKWWRTMHRRATGEDARPVSLDAFLDRLFEVAVLHTTPDATIFVEYGLGWHDAITRRIAAYGLYLRALATPAYGSARRPLNLYVLSKAKRDPLGDDYAAAIDGTRGIDTLRTAVRPFAQPGQAILDPCCGMGYTAQLAVEHGLTFYGNELNATRLEKTIARLRGAP